MAETQSSSALGAVSLEGSDLASLLQKEFRPKSDEAKNAVEAAVQTLAQQALSQTQLIGKDVVKSIQDMIAAIDKKLSDQVNQILHHEDFQKLEGAWRGLHYMVNNTETDEQLKIRVMNISKADLGKTLKRYKGTNWDQSPLFKKIYEEEYGQFGGEPFGCLVGDYHFDQSAPDVELLAEMAKVAAAAMAPFITGASPNLMQMDSWQELANPRDLTKIFSTPEYAAWRSLRESDDSKYLGLAMPRFLSRLPYGAKTNPVEEFKFRRGNRVGRPLQVHVGQCCLCDGHQHQPLVQGVWLVFANPGYRVWWCSGELAHPQFPDRRWRRGHEVPNRSGDCRSA